MTAETFVGLNELAVAILAVIVVAGVVRVIVDMVEGGEPQPADPEPIANETESGYARRWELVAEARRKGRSR